MALTRRSVLCGGVGAIAFAAGCGRDRELAPPPSLDGGERLEVLEWPGEDAPPFGTAVGRGWDGRRYLDLAALGAASLVTPTDAFFVRTFRPASLATPPEAWTIRVGGPAGQALGELPLAELRPRPLGSVLIECAGNDASARFGLMSCAEWEGVPLAELLATLFGPAGADAVRVSGVDDHAEPSRGGHSQPGAAWVFRPDELARTGAFLATGMNGAALGPDHGAPVRLVVPGWYGCTHVKWVHAIDRVGHDAPATSQMREFARRTHQRGVPELARDYRPAAVDAAALPVRVERWRVGGESVFRVVGIAWGGDGTQRGLRLRVEPGGHWQPVAGAPPAGGRGWTLWECAFRPARAGAHVIRCRFAAGVVQRRQAAGFHDRALRL